MSNLERFIERRLGEMQAEVERLTDENQSLREQLEASEACLDDEEAGSLETLDMWKHQKAEASRLRSALGSIHAIATDLSRDIWSRGVSQYAAGMAFELIRNKATEALETTSVQVTDDDGEAS